MICAWILVSTLKKINHYLWNWYKIYISKGSNVSVGKIYYPEFYVLQIFNKIYWKGDLATEDLQG